MVPLRALRIKLGAALILALLMLCLIPVPAHSVSGRMDPALLSLASSEPKRLVQVIVQERGSGSSQSAVKARGGQIVHVLPIINGYTARLSAHAAASLSGRADVKFVSLDRVMIPTGGPSAPPTYTNIDPTSLATTYPASANAVEVWNQAAGMYTGSGVTVALLDSGVNGSPDLGNRLVHQEKVNQTAMYAADRFGHGTHVAGIIAGSSPGGKYIGIAPGASLVSVKMSDDSGAASESDVIAAAQWVFSNRSTYNIRVVNISSTAGTQLSYHDDPLDAAVEKLWFAGITVVVAAGNKGGEQCSVCYAPANDPYVITVGAIDDKGTSDWADDFMPTWSSSGTTQDGFTKPDVLAPGSRIVSLLAGGNTTLATQWPQNVVENNYFRMGGTSMAAPVVAGTVALMLQANPALTPDQIKWILQNTGRAYTGRPRGGAGVVNAYAAVNYTLGSKPKAPELANVGLTPSRSLNVTAGEIVYSNVYWNNVYWNNVYWNNDTNR